VNEDVQEAVARRVAKAGCCCKEGACSKAEPDPRQLSRGELVDFLRARHTVTLWPFAGRALGLSRSATYGCPEIKCLRLGHLRRVSSAWLESVLFGGE
jgi:hypothetical protein